MKKGIVGKKLGMTQLFDANGNVVPVTVIEAGPCVISQKKTAENDGYEAVQIGFGDLKASKVKKPMKGHFAKGDVAPKRTLREFRLDNDSLELGQIFKADIFAEGDKVDVTAKSKGKGYAGGLKRHGLHSGPSGHGSKYHRHAGSNGSATTPGRVMKGKKMPGQMGMEQVTVQNLEVVKIDVENDLILVRGAVPGAKKSLVCIAESVKAGK